MGQKPTEEELFQMISEVDDNMSGSIDWRVSEGKFFVIVIVSFARASSLPSTFKRINCGMHTLYTSFAGD